MRGTTTITSCCEPRSPSVLNRVSLPVKGQVGKSRDAAGLHSQPTILSICQASTKVTLFQMCKQRSVPSTGSKLELAIRIHRQLVHFYEPHTPGFRVNLGPVWPSSSHQSSAALAAFRYSRLDSNADVRNVQLERALEKHSQIKRSSRCHRPGPGPARPGLVLGDRAGPGRYSRVAGNDAGRCARAP